MELNLKLLCVIPIFLLVLDVSQTHGSRIRPHLCKHGRPCIMKIPPRPSVIPQAKCKDIVSKLPKKARGSKYEGFICLQLNENQLLAILKNIGGYIPRYVAINSKEALKFDNLAMDAKPLPDIIRGNQSNVSNLISQKNNMVVTNSEDEAISKRRRNRLPSSAGTTTNQECFEKGTLVEGSSLKRMCTECSTITQLPANEFPRYINEVICDGTFCYPNNAGMCQQKVLKLKFLRFTGNYVFDPNLQVYVQEFETFDQDIQTCCECRVFPNPFFGGRR